MSKFNAGDVVLVQPPHYWKGFDAEILSVEDDGFVIIQLKQVGRILSMRVSSGLVKPRETGTRQKGGSCV